MDPNNFDMYRVVFLPKLAGYEDASCVWHPTRAAAEQWADYFARHGRAVAVQRGHKGELQRWTPRV